MPTKEEWLRAKADLAAVEAERDRLLAPIKDRLDAAVERLWEIEEAVADVATCEDCGDPIFDGDPSFCDGETSLCIECAPTWQDMLNSYSHWESTETGDPLTEAEAKAWAQAHIDAGGNLTDSMAS